MTDEIGDSAADRLAAIRARRAQLAAERDARNTERETREAVELAERELREDEAIDAAEAKHGAQRIRVLRTHLGAIVMKAAHPAVWKKFQDLGRTKMKDLEELVRPHVVHPDAAGLDRIFDELPGMIVRCADAMAWLAGHRAEDMQGKS